MKGYYSVILNWKRMDLINTTFRINVPLSEADIEVLSHPLGDII